MIEADVSGGDLGSDGGLLLLRQVDRRIGLTRQAAAALRDSRDRKRIHHELRDLHLLDRIWEKHQLKDTLGAHLVRHADDFVVLCKRGVEEPLKL